MAATPIMSILAAKAALDAVLAKLTTTSTIEIRTGALEATTLTADAGTLLAILTYSTTAFPASTSDGAGNALGTANAITSGIAIATGTAAHFRAKSAAGVVILQGTVGTSLADMIINSTSVTTGDTVGATSHTVKLACGDGVS